MILIQCINILCKPEVINFPDGTFKIDVNIPVNERPLKIIWQYENEAELIILMYTVNNLKERYAYPFELYMPYLPNARMDRVHKASEVFTLKYFCSVINSLGFEKVEVLDVHSEAGFKLLERAENRSPQRYIKTALDCERFDRDEDYIFFPDEGSCKRYSPLIKDFVHIGYGIKRRNWEDGKILGLDIAGESPEGRRVFIIDDICSYGGTAYHSALKLKELGCGDIFAYFTHCENSIAKGHLLEGDLIKRIFATNSLCTLDLKQYHPKLMLLDCGLDPFF